MPRTCSVCKSPDREAINAALLGNESFRHIAARYVTSTTSLQRHKADHLPAAIVKAAEVLEVIEAGTLLDRLKALNRETLAILKESRAVDSKDNELALKAIARVEKQLELEGRLLGELNESTVVNVTVTPEWQRIRAVLLVALEPYPVARLAIAEALNHAGA